MPVDKWSRLDVMFFRVWSHQVMQCHLASPDHNAEEMGHYFVKKNVMGNKTLWLYLKYTEKAKT